MEAYIDAIIANPFVLFQATFALLAGLAFVIFLGGFLGGASNFVTLSENIDHMTHARTRAVWGAGWLFVLFIEWEVLRWLASFF